MDERKPRWYHGKRDKEGDVIKKTRDDETSEVFLKAHTGKIINKPMA